MQDTYPYITDYCIVPITVLYDKNSGDSESTAVQQEITLYYISVPLLYIYKDEETNEIEHIKGHLYFNLSETTDIFSIDKYKEAVKEYFATYETILYSDNIVKAIAECPLLISGDMYVSENIYNVLTESGVNIANIVSIEDNDIITDISELTNDELYNKDILHFIYINKARIASIPETSNTYTDDELNAFASTFFNIIKQHSEGKYTGTDTVTGKIYSSVIDYYINNKVDATVSLLDLILGSSYSYYNTTVATTSSCGCSSSASDTTSPRSSCLAQYQTAMNTWTVQMMSDITSFYNKYFYKEATDEETGEICYEPDTDLIDALVLLIDEFKTLGYDLSFSTDTTRFNACNCKSKNTNSTASDCNYVVLDNFKSLLLYIKNNEVEGNENKIKSYGAAFGTLVDKMYF